MRGFGTVLGSTSSILSTSERPLKFNTYLATMKTTKIIAHGREFTAVVESALYAGFIARLEDDTEEGAEWGYTEEQALEALTEAVEWAIERGSVQ